MFKRGVKGRGTVLLKATCLTVRRQIEGSEAIHIMSFNLERVVMIRIYKIKAVGRMNADFCPANPAVLELRGAH